MSSASNAPTSGPIVAIRSATERDVAALTRVINLAFVVEQIAFDGDRVDETAVCGYMSRGHFLVGELVGACVGCVYIELRGERSYLGLLSVEPTHQGTGLGRRLMSAAEKLARSLGSRVMDLRIISPRAEALLPFYQQLGYTFIRNEPFPLALTPKIPSHYLLMSKPLT